MTEIGSGKQHPLHVMAMLVTAIHDFLDGTTKTWMAGTIPALTLLGCADLAH
jgi:hypothetical protein